MEKFVIFWLDGTTTIVSGESRIDAVNKAGIGAGALGSIDFIGEGESSLTKWAWDESTRGWGLASRLAEASA